LGSLANGASAKSSTSSLAKAAACFTITPAVRTGTFDHVVVAPSGVYAIETKTRNKRCAPKKDYEVSFDGAKLHFPNFVPICGLDQARRNAADLSRVLTSAVAEPMKVRPILTFSGWFIIRRGKSDVTVVNLKKSAKSSFQTTDRSSPPKKSSASPTSSNKNAATCRFDSDVSLRPDVSSSLCFAYCFLLVGGL
jgi:hypothetical protein